MKKLLALLFVCLSSTVMFAQNNGAVYITEPFYEEDHTGCNAFQTKITGYLEIDHVEQVNGWLEIGAFDQDGVCRCSSAPKYRLSQNHWVYQMKIWGTEGFEYTFRVYDHENHTELPLVDDFGEIIEYVSNAQHGSTSTYYHINFTNPNGGIDLNITPYTAGERDRYYLIASPVGDVLASSVNNLLENNYDLYYFNQEQDKEWINYVAGGEISTDPEFASMEGKLMAGRGYLYANSGDGEHDVVTLTFPGDAYTTADGTAEFELEYVEGHDMTGWNLIGNPFNTPAFIYGFDNFYVMNDLGTDVMESSGEIAPMQGIFVLATAPGTVTFSGEESDKVSKLSLNLVRGNKVIDRASVSFGGSSLPKFQINRNSTKVYIPMDGEDFAVVSSEEMGEMPVNFKAENNGSYTLTLSTELSFSYLHLIDNMTGADVDLLATPSYSFDALTTDYASRFRLVFATGSSVDGDNFSFVNAAGNLCIFGIEGEATLQVMDVTGRILGTETFSGSYEKQLNVAPGVYMLRLTNGNNVKVQKMVVR